MTAKCRGTGRFLSDLHMRRAGAGLAGWGRENSNYGICQGLNPSELRRKFLPDLAKRMVRDVSRVSCALATLQLRQGLRPFGPTRTLAKCLSALASARLFAGNIAKAQRLHNEAIKAPNSTLSLAIKKSPAKSRCRSRKTGAA